MKVLILYDKSGPKYHRLLLPCYLMDIELIVNHSLEEIQLNGVDILFINRVVGGTSLQKILDLRDKYGFKLVVDFDDHWRLSPDHLLYESYKEFMASEIMEAYIQEADHVTVTHERLRDEVLPFNKNVTILPNAIPKFGQFLTTKIESSFTRLFWAGGVTHKKDIELLKYPLRKLSEPVQMIMGGYVDNPEYKAMASAFTNGAKLYHQLIESLPVDQYYHSYKLCDISLIPLTRSTFNVFKSNLKILEAANIAAPVIVSKVHPYLDIPHVNYVESQKDWVKHITYLVKNPEQAKQQGLALQKYCDENFNFERINQERKNLFHVITGK